MVKLDTAKNGRLLSPLRGLIVTLIICGFFFASLGVASWHTSVEIPTSGVIADPEKIMAASGSPSDIQSAVNLAIAAGGGTVYIPAGDWVCNQTLNGAVQINLEDLPSGAWLNIVGSGENTTIVTQNGVTITGSSTILRSYTSSTDKLGTFKIVGSPLESGNFNNYKSINRHIRISNLTILGSVPSNDRLNYGIDLSYVDGFLVDHVTIDSQNNAGITTLSSKGVISHCAITDYYRDQVGGVWGYGVIVTGNSLYWNNGLGTPTWIINIDSVIGKYDWAGITINYGNPRVICYNEQYHTSYTDSLGTTSNISFTAGPIYIEDSYFNNTRHPVSSSQYGYYVFRYNYVETNAPNLQAVDQHGRGFPAGVFCEVYNNTIENSAIGITLRAGGALIFNNNFPHDLTGVFIGNEAYNATGTPYDYQYINNVWIWNNTGSNLAGGWYSIYGTFNPYTIQSGNNITLGTHVFTDSWRGLTNASVPLPPKLGYIPYTYPHPLVG
jgi:hypothetical protein